MPIPLCMWNRSLASSLSGKLMQYLNSYLFKPDLLALVDLYHLAILDYKANSTVADFLQGSTDAQLKFPTPLLGVCGQISLSHYSSPDLIKIPFISCAITVKGCR
jgi:hypothetical protein